MNDHAPLPISAVASPDRDGDLCVARVPLFQALDRQAQLEVARVARPTPIAKGQLLYAAGSDASQMMVVHTGQLKLSRINEEGHEQIVRVLGPGDFVGESAFLLGGQPDHFATAIAAGSLCLFRHADLGRLVEQHPSIGLRMLQEVSRRLGQTEKRLAAAISSDVSSRLARYLLSLPGARREGRLHVELPLAKKDIASLLDTTPESLSRQLRRLQDSGVIDQDGSGDIVLIDPDGLMRLAGRD
ncbi:Crp/Fnr family transcriptional regulator [Demequina aurantiaca]|uniref:Crp/Fnr family transcriptional regulator n=1 Tax=Demequina aurantiaca TaxID=676200 RepID=UPI003D345598